jgi:transposase
MTPLTVAVDVSPRDREALESWLRAPSLRAPSLRAGLVAQARIVLLAADGVAVKDIVERVGVSKPTVIGWKKRYAAEGIGGLEDRPKPGRRRVVEEVAVATATLEPPPERLGVTHWSSRRLGAELGISRVWVGKIWRRRGLQPWRADRADRTRSSTAAGPCPPTTRGGRPGPPAGRQPAPPRQPR